MNFNNGFRFNFTKLNPSIKPFPERILSLRVVNFLVFHSLVLCNFVMPPIIFFTLPLLKIIQFFLSTTTKLSTLIGIPGGEGGGGEFNLPRMEEGGMMERWKRRKRGFEIRTVKKQ